MATVIERDVHHQVDNSSSTAMTWIVALFALVVLIGLAMFVFKLNPFAPQSNVGTPSNPIQVDVNGQVPATPQQAQ